MDFSSAAGAEKAVRARNALTVALIRCLATPGIFEEWSCFILIG
jgi:hypothetical protein